MKRSNIFALFFGVAVGAVAGGTLVKKLWLDKYCKQKDELKVVNHERELLYQLLKLKKNNMPFSEYFQAYDLHSVAILGMGFMGRYLLDVLTEEGSVTVAYGVEFDVLGAVHKTLPVYRLGQDDLPAVDSLLVCDLYWNSKSPAVLQEEISARIVTITQLLEWLKKHAV
ncbi:hypothetical protein D5272_12720 [bacterium D16-76]|nr:hypothetical protein [bacterium D16-76]